ncbi:DNA polymerase III subunit delta' [Pelomonas sp. SE-A7]|uniref:DNA polymerase III subunit delta' n=1 Tax=Pelomonas sp. SE-A7 TaxID=3054953 RepID=UPI00259CC50B|nr:DNA polymerase III subunit delta' [Pelomonas sp. SE-A7]MDM4765167.1 DNA polymerase III subunit delta' [Pelomonas sp. SE-A7]
MVSSSLLPWLHKALQAGLGLRSHALLIQGPAGVGQFDLAMQLAASWLCESSRGQGPACGLCASCKLLQSRTHPDFQLLVPEALREGLGLADEAGEGETKASKTKPSREIKIDAVRATLAFAQATSARGQAKVVVIYPAEALNTVAANALLKTLEEPSGLLRFVLASDEPQALLPTIRSRCQALSLALPAREQAVSWLAGQGVEQAEVLLRAAGGRPNLAQGWAQDGLSAAAWLALPKRLARGEVSAISDWPVPRAIDALQRLNHDLLRLAHGAGPSYFPAEALPKVRQGAPLQAWGQALQRAMRHAEHPLNAGLLLESLVGQGQSAIAEAVGTLRP